MMKDDITTTNSTTTTPNPTIATKKEEEKEIPWLEHQVHTQKQQPRHQRQMDGQSSSSKATDDDDDNDDENYMNDFLFHMFDQPNDVVYNTYTYTDTTTTTTTDDDNDDESAAAAAANVLTIRGQEELGNSTGLSVCWGAEVLYEFLKKLRTNKNTKIQVSRAQQDIDMTDKMVIELGAGTGLCGLYVAKYLDASCVVMTDGDTSVLQNMRYNVAQNMKNNGNDNGDTNIHCEQLIWGSESGAQRILTKYGQRRPDIILAADCLYMAPAVQPFWSSIDYLFGGSNSGGDNVNDNEEEEENDTTETSLQIVIYVLVSASQVPPQMISDEAQRYGFTTTLVDKDVYCYSRPNRRH